MVRSQFVDLRPDDVRDRFDRAVLAFVRRSPEPVAVGFVLAHLGGTPGQIRVALSRFTSAGILQTCADGRRWTVA